LRSQIIKQTQKKKSLSRSEEEERKKEEEASPGCLMFEAGLQR